MSTENRLVEMEIKLSYQEDLLETLNTTVYQQQRQIDKLEGLFAALAQQVRENVAGHSMLNQERPPHY